MLLHKKCPAFSCRTFWWEKMDSNHRSWKQQIYSLPPLATREFSHKNSADFCRQIGAGGRTRTPDLLITNQLLYQLSYTSIINACLLYHKIKNLSTPDFRFFWKSLVEATGLEPAASWSQTKHSTKLSYAPYNFFIIQYLLSVVKYFF